MKYRTEYRSLGPSRRCGRNLGIELTWMASPPPPPNYRYLSGKGRHLPFDRHRFTCHSYPETSSGKYARPRLCLHFGSYHSAYTEIAWSRIDLGLGKPWTSKYRSYTALSKATCQCRKSTIHLIKVSSSITRAEDGDTHGSVTGWCLYHPGLLIGLSKITFSPRPIASKSTPVSHSSAHKSLTEN